MKLPKIQLEPRSIYLVGGTGALLVAVLLVRFVYLPVLAQIGERQAALCDLRVKIADAHVLISQRQAYEAALQEVRKRYRALVEHRVGAEQSVARVLDALSEEAKAHRLELVATQPQTVEGEQHLLALGQGLVLREVPLTLQLSGRYRQVGEFLGALRDASFIASVQKLTLAKAEANSSKLRADISLAVYLPERNSAARNF